MKQVTTVHFLASCLLDEQIIVTKEFIMENSPTAMYLMSD